MIAIKDPRDRRELGHTFEPATRLRLKRFERTKTWLTVLTALGDHAAVYLIMIAMAIAISHPAGWLLLPLAWVLIARFQRGLENLVHEGAHYNWARPINGVSPRVNDLLANSLAAVPMFTDVDQMRGPHRQHHVGFGGDTDPDLARYEILGIDDLDRANAPAFCLAVARRIGTYTVGWWKAVGTNPGTVAKSLTWHALVYVLPLSMAFGFTNALFVWTAVWLAGFTFGLSMLRFFAESAKHRYTGTTSVFTATISNLGLVHQAYLHPHGDGHHLLHHLNPNVPHHALKAAHAFLLANDEAYANGSLERLHVFEHAAPSGACCSSCTGHCPRARQARRRPTPRYRHDPSNKPN